MPSAGARRPTRGRGVGLPRQRSASDRDYLVAAEDCIPDDHADQLEPSLPHLSQFRLQC